MKQKEGLVLRQICGENVVVAEGLKVVDFGKMVSMNDTAVWVWEKCSELGDFTTEQLADALCQEYNVEPEKALNDVNRLLGEWKDLGMIE